MRGLFFKLVLFNIFLSTLLCCVTVSASRSVKQLSPKAIAALNSSKKNIRIAGIASLAKSNNPKARPYLEKMLYDSESTVRASAAEALGKLKDIQALKSLYRLENDPSSLVRKFVKRSLAILEKIKKNSKQEIHFYFSKVRDTSKHLPTSLQQEMQQKISTLVTESTAFSSQSTLTKSFDLSDLHSTESGYQILLKTSKIRKKRQGEVHIITVKCEVMILTYPGSSLRLQSSATAGAGIEGPIDTAMREELLSESIDQCSQSLAQDIIEFTVKRRKKMGTL